MKTLKLFILSLLFALTAYAGNPAPQDTITTPLCNGIKWGMTQEQVQQLAPGQLTAAKDSLLTCTTFQLYVYKTTQTDSSKWFTAITTSYIFTESKLTGRDIAIAVQGNLLAAHARYLELKNIFTQKYGAPAKDNAGSILPVNIESAEWAPEEQDSSIKLNFNRKLQQTFIYYRAKE